MDLKTKSILLSYFAVLLFSTSLLAQNPVIQTHYSPDPAPLVHNGTVYVYTGDDIPGYDFYYMTKWRVHSSTDMVNWTDHGSPIALESFSWARDRAWAAQCIARNGKFYWYICAQTTANNMAVGVAVSDKPTGPFRDALNKPLITTGNWSNIDPTVYIDDDGQAYLYWGNGSLYYVKLNTDMISYSGEIMQVPQTAESFGGVRSARNANGQNGSETAQNKDMYVEGPWFYKHAGKYYLMYAGMRKGGETLSYTMSDKATGPWKYQGKIMADQPANSFTNHGGIIDFKGKSYLFYHTGLLPGGGSYGRSTAIEEFKYNPDGTIPVVKMTKAGVGPVGLLNPYKRTEAETIAWAEKCSIDENKVTGVYVSKIRTGGYIKVRSVDFGSNSPRNFSANIAAGLDGGILEVRADSLTGIKLANISVPRTGGWTMWKQLSSAVDTAITGVHDIYFVFKGQNITAGRELYNFDYWKFEH
ncbi:glycoside hydrolase family 43 protein [Mucilaginibacter sp. PAMB04274]|uniref:glycoside hydrolase family 43 protein n=1 Tax=Mucilaginibacter sp. PAMB04274 TaxID=3138568 RepID=UPI0031F713BB